MVIFTRSLCLLLIIIILNTTNMVIAIFSEHCIANNGLLTSALVLLLALLGLTCSCVMQCLRCHVHSGAT